MQHIFYSNSNGAIYYLLDCSSDTHVWDTNLQTCVCVADFYQTAPATDIAPPDCTACPVGSTTIGNTNSDDISACGKDQRVIIAII